MITQTQHPTPSPTTPTHKEEQPFSMLLKIATIIQSNINPHSNHNETLTPMISQYTITLTPHQIQFNTTITTPLPNHQKMKQQHNHPTTNDIKIKSNSNPHNTTSNQQTIWPPITTSQTTTTPRTQTNPIQPKHTTTSPLITKIITHLTMTTIQPYWTKKRNHKIQCDSHLNPPINPKKPLNDLNL